MKNILYKEVAKVNRFVRAENVTEILRNIIKEHHISPNTPLPPEREISQIFKVSRNTARKALADLIKDNIIYRVHGKGTFIASKDDHTKKNSKLTIGLILAGIGDEAELDEETSPFHYHVLSGIESIAAEHNYTLSLLGRKSDIPYLQKCLADLPVDALMVLNLKKKYDFFIEDLKKSGKPFVLVLCDHYRKGVNIVDFNHFRTGYKITEYLVRSGRSKIFFGLTHPSDFQGKMRREGYYKYVDEHGLAKATGFLYPNELPSTPISKKVIQKIFKNFDAFTADDYRVSKVMKEARKCGKKIPEDLAVFGYFNRAFCRQLKPSLSSVNLPRKELGNAAIKLLEEVMANPDTPPKTVLVDTELVIRDSSG